MAGSSSGDELAQAGGTVGPRRVLRLAPRASRLVLPLAALSLSLYIFLAAFCACFPPLSPCAFDAQSIVAVRRVASPSIHSIYLLRPHFLGSYHASRVHGNGSKCPAVIV
jgi:hypothetical protein